MKRHNFFIELDLVARMRNEAKQAGVSMAEILRRALRAYLIER
jgi:hypothetical protein